MTTRPRPNRYPHVLPALRTLAADAVAEFKFCPTRRWRADFALPSDMILVEIDGGAYSGGRHTRGAGFVADMEKANAAAVLGYRVVRFTPQQARTSLLIDTVRACQHGPDVTIGSTPMEDGAPVVVGDGHISAADFRKSASKGKRNVR